MSDDWSIRMAELAVLASVRKSRVLGFTGHHEGDVAHASRAMATFVARSGKPTLLMRLVDDGDNHGDAAAWSPGVSGAAAVAVEAAAGYRELHLPPRADVRHLFSNIEHLRFTLGKDLVGYGAVVIELPRIPQRDASEVNAASVAAVCDAVYLVCRTGHVTGVEVKATKQSLARAGVKLAGVILNEANVATPPFNFGAWLRGRGQGLQLR